MSATPKTRPAQKRRPSTKPRKSPQQARARATVDAIVQASAYILTKRGYAGFTTNAVAEKSGVNIASLYQYFPNKEAIFAELVRRHAEDMRKRALAVVQEGKGRSLETNARRVVEAAIAEHSVDPALHRVLTTEAPRLGLARMETSSDAAIAAESAHWVATTRRPNAELALWIATTAVHAVIHAAFVERPDDARSPGALTDELTRLLVKYLR